MTVTQIVHDIGDHVECDFCSRHFDAPPNSEMTGGLLFERKAACPICAPRVEAGANKYNETRFIGARAKSGERFRDFVLGIRGGDNRVIITTAENIGEAIEVMRTGGLVDRKTENPEDKPI